MFKCRKKVKERTVVVENEYSTGPLEPNFEGRVSVALVVGHNKKDQGAVNYLGESEYIFGRRIARKVQTALADGSTGLNSVVFERNAGSYSSQVRHIVKKCSEVNAKISVHLHFNSASSKAKGCEVLVAPTDTPLDNRLAATITDKLNERYGFKERGNNGVKTIYKGHRGFKMLGDLAEEGTIPVLLEPCFAHHRYRESIIIFEEEDKYVDVIVDSIKEVLLG